MRSTSLRCSEHRRPKDFRPVCLCEGSFRNPLKHAWYLVKSQRSLPFQVTMIIQLTAFYFFESKGFSPEE